MTSHSGMHSRPVIELAVWGAVVTSSRDEPKLGPPGRERLPWKGINGVKLLLSPSSLEILKTIRDKPKTVSQIAKETSKARQTVHRKLRALLECGVVARLPVDHSNPRPLPTHYYVAKAQEFEFPSFVFSLSDSLDSLPHGHFEVFGATDKDKPESGLAAPGAGMV